MRLKDFSILNPAYQGPFLEKEVSFVPMESLRCGRIDYQEIAFLEAKGKYTFFANGDLLIAKVTPCFENGNIAIANGMKEGLGFGSSEIFVLRADKSVLNTYMFYVVQTSKFQDAACATMCGVGGLKRISPLFMRTYELSIPTFSDQQRIVDYLDDKSSSIDTQIVLLGKKKDAYTRLKKAMINRAITRGLDEQMKLKDSGMEWIGMIPEHWEMKRFKEFANAIKGKQCDYFDEKDENMEVVLTVETLRQDKPTFFNYGIVEDKTQLCDENDMVIIWDGAGVGEFLKAKKGVLSSTIARIDVNEKKIFKPYLWQWRYQIEYRLKSVPTGMGIPHLNPTLLNNYIIPVPPLSEQQAIAAYLDEQCAKIGAAISNIDNQIDALKRLKRSLINEVITGQRAI